MMKFRIIAIGRKARDPLIEALEDYLSRLNRYVPTEFCRIREGTQAEEARSIAGKLSTSDYVIALDPRGTLITTESIANASRLWQEEQKRVIHWVVGGADGLTNILRSRAQGLWSLGRITLPHRLAHVVLVEQLYRAQTLLRGEKYHRA